jgi:hypothetical protein
MLFQLKTVIIFLITLNLAVLFFLYTNQAEKDIRRWDVPHYMDFIKSRNRHITPDTNTDVINMVPEEGEPAPSEPLPDEVDGDEKAQ